MGGIPLEDVLLEAGKALFLISVPILIALSLASLLVTALQSSMAILEPALGYTVRMAALVLVLYFFLPSFVQSLESVCSMVYG